MAYLVICTLALGASGLTFLTGFGLGTLLLPVFAAFYPVEHAVALTAVVHFLTGVFKVVLVGRHAHAATVLRFGLPAFLAAMLGAWVLVRIASAEPVYSYHLLGRVTQVTVAKLVVGVLLFVFALVEVVPRLRAVTFGPRYVVLGGVLSGFIGGLSGMQGALRSAFLARGGLSKDAFVATGAVVGCLIDLSRLGVYAAALTAVWGRLDTGLLAAAVVSAFAGASLGNKYLKAVTMSRVRQVVAGLLFAFAVGLVTGLL